MPLVDVPAQSRVWKTVASVTATAAVQIRWSPYLTVIDPGTERPDPTACIVNDGGWIRVYLPGEGAFQLVSRFEIDARWRTDVGSDTAGWGSGNSLVLFDDLVIVNLSGRGDKDMDTYSRLL